MIIFKQGELLLFAHLMGFQDATYKISSLQIGSVTYFYLLSLKLVHVCIGINSIVHDFSN